VCNDDVDKMNIASEFEIIEEQEWYDQARS
jgi:hypothetical protein